MLLPLIRSKVLAYQVSVLDSDVQKRTLTRCLIVGYGSFVEVPAVVKLVAIQLLPAMRAPPTLEPLGLVRYAGRQVAVRLLGCPDKGDDTIQVGIEFRVVVHGQRIRSSLDDFIRVCVVEGEISLVFALD